MQIRRLVLRGFRNYRELDFSVAGQLCLLLGENAQGKTSLLEAIYCAATGRSFRASLDEELIAWNSREADIRCLVEKDLGEAEIEIQLSRGRNKRIRVNGQLVRRHSDLFGHLNVVTFTPDDLQLVKGSPAGRRRFLDIELAQVSGTYRHDLLNYHHILRQRNSLLKSMAEGRENRETREALAMWDEQLVRCGSRVMWKRTEAVAKLAAIGRHFHGEITNGAEELTICYRPFYEKAVPPTTSPASPAEIETAFRAALARLQPVEIRRGQTMVGPQRDDIDFLIDRRPVRIYGSQGQQRTAVLAGKLAEVDFMREETNEYPVLLLDDVMSELDQQRRQFFLQSVTGRVQTFITATSQAYFPEPFLQKAQVATIKAGSLEV
ncbi:MAG TPA: DNA replication/repair protein RecF [Firmicutes bacterium]|nr:DNA replication/repair protein RecF [Bacillota bacterium]